jgi:S1-C subfamily serine protease
VPEKEEEKMFKQSCSQIRNALYGVIGSSKVGNQINCSNGTAFMIAPGVLATAAHLAHVESNPSKPAHTLFETIRAPDIGQSMEKAQLIAEDPIRDIAILRINNPRSNTCVTLEPNVVPIGTSCGSLGFPLASITFTPAGKAFNLVERFQGSSISAFHTQTLSGRQLSFYEIDALMYGGSSGCPGFLVNANVFGMQVRSVIDKPRGDLAGPHDKQAQTETRLAISILVPSIDIIAFAKNNGIAL